MADQKYHDYIASNEWKKKRLQRLAISKFCCSVCGSKHRLEVHHLTYARLFNEDMEDLLPLCYAHHMAAEELISKGGLSRTGNPIFLASETIRLVVPRSSRKKGRSHVHGVEVRNRAQETLLEDEWFVSILPKPRAEFKRLLRKHFVGIPNRSRLIANGFAIYDRQSRRAKRSAKAGRKWNYKADLVRLVMDF